MKRWRLKDIILASILGALFALICFTLDLVVVGPIVPLFALLGLSGMEFDVFIGLYLFSVIFAPYIMQKAGVATIVGFLTGFIQILFGSPWAATIWLLGLVQGFGAEVGFALFRYKKWHQGALLIAATGATIASGLFEWRIGLWMYLSPALIATRFLIRLVSAWFFAGFLAKRLADRLAKAGVLKSYPLGEQENVFKGH